MARLVLLRHGESVWNRDNRFTGWTDVDLSARGIEEAHRAAKLLETGRIIPEWCGTSLLKRAIRTLWIVLAHLDRMWLPVEKSWRLNERHYGALQGRNKAEAAEKLGADQVQRWRRSFEGRPPPLDESDERFPGRDPRYGGVPEAWLPRSESLEDTVERVVPYWKETLSRRLTAHETVLIVAHGNSLRALVKYLDRMDDDEVARLEIPTGLPLLYRLDGRLRPVERDFLQTQSVTP